ncbi:hypothetical protein BDV97DRAFT_346930 [Delphinella strobiligena]|nr:hypothetical protein BDV97DRAFT_346930 [Delphinella strobiligena]
MHVEVREVFGVFLRVLARGDLSSGSPLAVFRSEPEALTYALRNLRAFCDERYNDYTYYGSRRLSHSPIARYTASDSQAGKRLVVADVACVGIEDMPADWASRFGNDSGNRQDSMQIQEPGQEEGSCADVGRASHSESRQADEYQELETNGGVKAIRDDDDNVLTEDEGSVLQDEEDKKVLRRPLTGRLRHC